MLGQLVRFGLSGVVNTIIDFTIFNLLVYLLSIQSGFLLALINTAAVSAAAVNSYFLNHSWTFNCPNKSSSQVIRFAAATLAGLFLNSLVVTLAGSLIGLWPLPAYLLLNGGKIIASIVSATFNFFAYRSWVFPSVQHSPPTAADFKPFIPGLVSIVIPAYNESNRLPARIQHLGSLLPNRFPAEIIVVNDGSTDNTLQLAEDLAVQYPCLKPLGYSSNQGKGKAVQTGMLAARGEWVIYTDADDTFTADHIQQVADDLRSGEEVVIACRQREGQNRLQGESTLRRLMGRIFNGMVQLLLLPGMNDTQCGLKGFQRKTLEELFPRQTIQRFAFDVEILALAKTMGFRIKELPIAAMDCSGSQVNCLIAPVQMFWDVIKLKMNLLTNRYGLPGGYQPLRQLALVSSLFAAALVVRIPRLWEVPRFIDELKEVQLAYQIYQGKILPLTNVAQDIGALHNFILAALFKIFGPSIYLPRLYVVITAAATVVLLYYLTRQLFGHWAGLIAAGLLMTNGMHILVTHMAWSNCTTPFFFTLAVMAVITAEKYRSGTWLVISGFLWALTLQTHSSIIIFLAVTLFYVLRPQFRRRTGIAVGYYLGAAAALIIGYWNMLYFNVSTLGGSFYWLQHKSYAMENEFNPANYMENLGHLMVQLVRSVGSVYSAYNIGLLYLLHPAFLLVLTLLISGFIYCLRMKHSAFPLWLLIGGILVIPLFNQRYDFYISTRYIMPLIILSIMLVSLAAVQWLEHIKHFYISFPVLRLAAGIAVLVIVLQLFPLYRYYSRVADSNATNQVAFSILSRAENPSCGGPATVVIDEALQLENEPLPYLFSMTRQPFQMLSTGHDLTNQWRQCLSESKTATLVAVLNEETFSRLKDSLSAADVSCLKARIIIPHPSAAERKIYVVEIQREPRAEIENN